jgi:hypothetical protein
MRSGCIERGSKTKFFEKVPRASRYSSGNLERAEPACAASSSCTRNEMIGLCCGACVIDRDILFRLEQQPHEGGCDEPKVPVI